MPNSYPKANLSSYTHIYNEYSIEEYHLQNSLEDYNDYLKSIQGALIQNNSYSIPVIFHVLEQDQPNLILNLDAVSSMLAYLSSAFEGCVKFKPAIRMPDGRELDIPGLNISSAENLIESRIDIEGNIQTYEYSRDGITMHTEDPNIIGNNNSNLTHPPVAGITDKLLKDTTGFDPLRYFNIYLVNYLRDQAYVPNSLLASSINPVIAMKQENIKSFGVIVPYYSIPKDLYTRQDEDYVNLTWAGMDSYIWLTHAVGNSLGLVTTSNYGLDYRVDKKESVSYFAMGSHKNECRESYPCIFEDPLYEEMGQNVAFTNKHSGPCINEESIRFDVFKNNALDPLDCDKNLLRVDNIVAGIYPYVRVLDGLPYITQEQKNIVIGNLFIDFYSDSLEIVNIRDPYPTENNDSQLNQEQNISELRKKPGILHALIQSTVADFEAPSCEQAYPYTLSDIVQYSILNSRKSASNLKSVIKDPQKSFTYERSKQFESLLNRLQTLVNNIKYER